MQVRASSHVSLDFNSWICKIMLRSRVMPSLIRLLGMPLQHSLFRRVCSKTCPWSVATLLVVSSALER